MLEVYTIEKMEKFNKSFDQNTTKNTAVGLLPGKNCFTLFTPEAVQNTHGIFLMTFYLVVTLLIVFSNAIMMVALWKTNRRLTTAQQLFFTLCVMDLCVGVFFLPLQIYMIHIAEMQDCSLIMVQAFISIFFTFMAGHILLIIIIHRFCIVVNNEFCKKFIGIRNIRLCFVVAFFVSAGNSTWYAFNKRSPSTVYHGVFYLTNGIFVAGFLFLVTFINYKLIQFVKLAAASKAVKTSVTRNTYHRHVAKTLVLMSTVITVCYIPIVVSFITSGVLFIYKKHNMAVIQYMIPWSQMIMSLNSGLNSIIYVVRTKRINRYYKTLLSRSFKRNTNNKSDKSIGRREPQISSMKSF